MRVRSQKLSDFFNIGRDLGWDVERQRWTVHQLIGPEGRSYRISDLFPDGFPDDLPIVKSGNRYGYPPLRERIIASQHYDLPIDNVLVTLGTQMSNFLAFAVALGPGDEAIVDAPSWEQPRVVCEALGATVKTINRRAELGWSIDLDELRNLVTIRTRLIYLCHPNNPTGAVFSEDELRRICDIAAPLGIHVVSDEIYRGLEWTGELSPSAANMYEHGVTTSSVSKTLGMSGTRLGWLATRDRDFLERCLELKYYISLHQQSRLDETVAMAALEPDTYQALIRGTMDAARPSLEAVSLWMEGSDVFSWVPPGGGFLSFPSFAVDVPSWDLCVRLLKEPYRTYLIPGSCYGDAFEGRVRLGFGPETATEEIRAGLNAVDAFLEDHVKGRVMS